MDVVGDVLAGVSVIVFVFNRSTDIDFWREFVVKSSLGIDVFVVGIDLCIQVFYLVYFWVGGGAGELVKVAAVGGAEL